MKQIIFLHIGLHRTGTTFLQQEVFPKMDNVVYYRNVHNIDYSNKRILISSEDLSGLPLNSFSNEYRLILAHGLRNYFKGKHVKIILGLRNRYNWVNSLYMKYLETGGQKTFKQFTKDFDGNLTDFNAYIKLLRQLFEGVHIYRYENLKEYPDFTIKQLCTYCNCKMVDFNNVIYNKGLDKQKNILFALNNLRFYSKELLKKKIM